MASLKEAIVAYYREGRTVVEIVRLTPRLATSHAFGDAWKTINQRLVNRWLRKAKEEDPDLVIWHHLNRRRRQPGLYTNWRGDGFILLSPYYDTLTDTLYLGTGMDFEPAPGSRPPGNIIRYEGKQETPDYSGPGPRKRYSDAVGTYVAELHDAFGYSSRDIVKLWEKGKTRHPAKDNQPRVVWLVERLREVKTRAIGHTTVVRILKEHGYIRPSLESGGQGDK